VGIDVAKTPLDVAVRPDETKWQASNDADGSATLVTQLRALAPTLVVLEATGGLEVPIVGEPGVAGLAVAVVNPRQVRHFAQALGRLAKTDTLDAGVLARFGEALRPRSTALPSAVAQELAALVARRRQLVVMRTAEQNRLGATHTQAVRTRIAAHLTWLEHALAGLDHDLGERLKNSPIWPARDQALREVKGVGPILSLTLQAHLPELGRVSHQQLAALVGVAPFNRDSGRWRGPRTVWGGRAAVRAALYLATLRATRCTPRISAFYQCLVEAGKPKKVALVACMRKRLTYLNALAHHHPAWQAVAATPAA
jgi:transposase